MKETVSIEKVLNSRCSCDLDGDSRKNHWGKFVDGKHPSEEIVEHVLVCCKKTPQFFHGKLSVWFEDKYLFLGFEKTNNPFETRLLHIESGMQHEAVYLACTALGVGTCIHNLGINGTEYEDKIATARHMILESVEGYSEGKFSTAIPGPEKPFKRGKKLQEPRRNSDMECLPALEQITLSHNAGTDADENDISQMLWAAKGRTPHYIKSHPWGLTIPTWGGGQNYTSVYLIKENKIFRYVNWAIFRYIDWSTRIFPWWAIGNPTHDMKFVKKMKFLSKSDDTNAMIIMCRNEKTNRALWEVGYMLENMLLQANNLGIAYRSKVFTKDEVMELEKDRITGAVAALLL